MPETAMRVPSDLLSAAVRRNAAAPLVTWYDDGAGDRVELSATTLANWVAKSANLLQDEFEVGPGAAVALALPVHWQTAALLLAVWSCGAAVVDTAPENDGLPADVAVVLTTQDRIAALQEAGGQDGPELLGLSLHPLGLGMSDYVGSARDFALEVRVQGDVFTPYSPPAPDAPGLRAGGLELTLGGLVTTAAELAGRLGLADGDRVLIDTGTAAEAGPVAWLLAPLAAGASMVLCRAPVSGPDSAALRRRAEAERVTATLGLRIDGIRELGRPA